MSAPDSGVTEILFGTGGIAAHSRDAMKRICAITEEKLLPEAEAMNNEGLHAAAKVLNEIACSFAYGSGEKGEPVGERLILDPEVIGLWTSKLAAAPPVTAKIEGRFGMPDEESPSPEAIGLNRVCDIVRTELVPAVKTASKTAYVVNVTHSGESGYTEELKYDYVTGHYKTVTIPFTAEKAQLIPATFLDRGLKCSTDALAKLSCQAATGSPPDVSNEVNCLQQFTDILRSLSKGRKSW